MGAGSSRQCEINEVYSRGECYVNTNNLGQHSTLYKDGDMYIKKQLLNNSDPQGHNAGIDIGLQAHNVSKLK